jgi:hypothetical protein
MCCGVEDWWEGGERGLWLSVHTQCLWDKKRSGARSTRTTGPRGQLMSAIDDILASMRGHAKAPAAAAAQAHRSPSPAEDEEPNSSGEVPKLDGSRRVAGADALDYRFRSGLLQLSEEDAVALRADCSMAFALNSSNWLPAAAKPRCSLERLARTIFERHTAGVAFDAASSGAEWWAQVRGGGERHEGIEFHWDVDEHLCDLPGGGGVHVHPHLSTVTYLTNSGSPTLVLDAGAAQSSSRGAISALYGQVPSGALSYPRLGKTIVFDGAKLHGAVPDRPGSPSWSTYGSTTDRMQSSPCRRRWPRRCVSSGAHRPPRP